MFRLEHDIYLWALILIPLILFGMRQFLRRSNKLSELFNLQTAKSKAIRRTYKVRFVAFLIGFILFILAWTNPQWGTRKEEVLKTSSDIFIAVDISRSMLVEDVRPSRLARAKKIGQRIIQGLKNERIGLIFFAGEAYMQMPLTNDYAAASVFIQNATHTLAGVQGTAIEEAIELANTRYLEDEANERLLIIISDGEDHEQQAVARAEQGRSEGLIVFTIGIGTSEGGYIPMNYGAEQGFLRDKSGQLVKSTFRSDDLQAIAAAGGGLYLDAATNDDLVGAIRDRVKRLEKKEYTQVEFNARESYFQWFLFPAMILLCFSFLYKNKFEINDD